MRTMGEDKVQFFPMVIFPGGLMHLESEKVLNIIISMMKEYGVDIFTVRESYRSAWRETELDGTL